jgi:hypothetical protein
MRLSNQPEFRDQTRWVAGQCLEDIPPLFPGCREKRPDDGKVLRAVVGAEAAGDLLPQFHHPPIPLRQVIGEGHARISEEAEHIVFADTQAHQQIMANSSRLPAATLSIGIQWGPRIGIQKGPLVLRFEGLAAPSEPVGVAEMGRARLSVEPQLGS